MGMEGINWEEVNSQGNAILMALITLGADVFKYYQDFVDEMAYYWASGNAKIFGEYMQSDMRYFHDDLTKTKGEVTLLIKHAAEIYSRTFNVDNQISIGVVTIEAAPGSNVITNPFQETIRGVSGMNKNAVDDCYTKLKTNVENSIESAKSAINSIELSIFDIANAQKIAFSERVSQLYSMIEGYLAKALQGVEKYKNEEQDRITLAKQQTVSTFNA
jgi:hypothetical protein